MEAQMLCAFRMRSTSDNRHNTHKLLCFLCLLWFLLSCSLAADLPDRVVTPKPTKFQFARMRYPGGIPDYVKNWYTDYPNMDDHLTTLLRRLTGINVGPPLLVDPASPALFDYPLIYSVEP